MQNKKEGHTKHAKLEKPNLGQFGRNEWAFIGAPCDDIKDLVQRIAELSKAAILYIDESHNHNAKTARLSISTKKGEEQDFHRGLTWHRIENYKQFNDFDFVLVNGNHFKAKKQLVFLDPRKEESLSRKLDRLSDVRAFITTDQRQKPYDFLRNDPSSDLEVPSFHISDTEGIWAFLQQDFELPELKALVLAGGKSERMGQDKGAINYHGKGHARYIHEMLSQLGIDTYISCRSEQAKIYKDLPQIQDKFFGLGPFGAIASSFMIDPNVAWLVVPCDLPLLENKHIEKLTSNRNPYKFATAFLNNTTKFPEPLISIWEPKVYQHLLNFLAQGYSCPRKVLINSDVELIKVEDQQFMMNVNTPEELEQVSVIIEER